FKAPVAALERRRPAHAGAGRGALDVLRAAHQVQVLRALFAEAFLVQLGVLDADQRGQLLVLSHRERPTGLQVRGETIHTVLAARFAPDAAVFDPAGDVVVPPGETGHGIQVRAFALHAGVQRKVLRVRLGAIAGAEIRVDLQGVEAGADQDTLAAPGVEADGKAALPEVRGVGIAVPIQVAVRAVGTYPRAAAQAIRTGSLAAVGDAPAHGLAIQRVAFEQDAGEAAVRFAREPVEGGACLIERKRGDFGQHGRQVRRDRIAVADAVQRPGHAALVEGAVAADDVEADV